jgi:hypothetical protein
MTMKPRCWALAFFGLVGCVTVTSNGVRPDELARLDGYRGGPQAFGAEPKVQTLAGDIVTVRPDSYVFLELPGAHVGGRFESIAVRDGVFDGRKLDGDRVQVHLDQITSARVDQPNHLAPLMITGGVLAGALTILLGIYLYSLTHVGEISGRALRVRGRLVAAPVAGTDGWQRPGLRPDVSTLSAEGRRALAVAWTETARAEHASVPAFSRLSLTLVALGAPARLVERAHVAALEEIEHARLSFALAAGYAGEQVAPGPLAELHGAPAVTARSLAELAEESLVDGCLIEGVAAAAAAASLAGARDPAVRAALSIIARDEASHVALAWEIVGWCWRQGGADLRRRLLKLAHRMPSVGPPPEQPPRLAGELGAHGCLPTAAWRELLEQTRTEVASRVAGCSYF